MLKHYINIIDNTYYIVKDDVIIFSIKLKDDQIAVRNENGVFDGLPENLILENKKDELNK